MKIKICLLLLALTYACKRKTAVTESVFRPDKPAKNLSTQADSSLLGKWGMCSITGADKNGVRTMVMVNVCTEWLFKPDHTGLVGVGEPVFFFNWEIIDNILYIKNKGGDEIIKNGAYAFTEQRGDRFKTIVITDTITNTEYSLKQ